ncbi:MAG: hypothetical protein WCA85_02835 [Paraburkholderia sp.]|uniref:hypothetical protein n=1 Tax=Paraburkholderia sp. TaxID=1926495 RepID=UPI003C351870
MQHLADLLDGSSTPNAEDHSVCLEAHGFLNQSYDSVDSLLRAFVHSAATQQTDHASAVQVTVVGQLDGLAQFGHLFL